MVSSGVAAVMEPLTKVVGLAAWADGHVGVDERVHELGPLLAESPKVLCREALTVTPRRPS